MRYMHKTTTISFNAPTNVKSRLSKIADANGITISDLMRMGALQILAKGMVIEPELEPTPYLKKLIREADADYAAGRTTTVSSSKELDAHLSNLRK